VSGIVLARLAALAGELGDDHHQGLRWLLVWWQDERWSDCDERGLGELLGDLPDALGSSSLVLCP
jgi:hypothetical protein